MAYISLREKIRVSLHTMARLPIRELRAGGVGAWWERGGILLNMEDQCLGGKWPLAWMARSLCKYISLIYSRVLTYSKYHGL